MYGYIREKAYLATVLSYDEERGEAYCIQRNKFSVGEPIELLTPGGVGVAMRCEALYNEAHEPIGSVPHPLEKFYIRMPFAVKAGDILRSGKGE